jgi:3-oxoacyl-[acyl-carrier-protein] synthase III
MEPVRRCLAIQTSDRGVIGSKLLSDGSLWDLLYMHAPQSLNPDLLVAGNDGAHIKMEGREVFKHAVRAMEDAVRGLLQKQHIDINSVRFRHPPPGKYANPQQPH